MVDGCKKLWHENLQIIAKNNTNTNTNKNNNEKWKKKTKKKKKKTKQSKKNKSINATRNNINYNNQTIETINQTKWIYFGCANGIDRFKK